MVVVHFYASDRLLLSDDECFSGLSIADWSPLCEGPTLNIVEARLFKL